MDESVFDNEVVHLLEACARVTFICWNSGNTNGFGKIFYNSEKREIIIIC